MRRRLFSSAVGVGGRRGPAEGDAVLAEVRGSAALRAVDGGGMEPDGSGGGGSAGLMQQILSLKLVPRVGNGTLCPNSTSLCSFPGAAIAGVYRAAGKEMIPFEALTLGTGQTFCVVVVSFLRILATL